MNDYRKIDRDWLWQTCMDSYHEAIASAIAYAEAGNPQSATNQLLVATAIERLREEIHYGTKHAVTTDPPHPGDWQ